MNRFFRNTGLALFITSAALGITGCESEEDMTAPICGTFSLSGTVTDEEGNPVSGAEVIGHMVDIAGYPSKVKTNSDGTYGFVNTEATEMVVLTVSATGYDDFNSVLAIEYTDAIPGLTLGKAEGTYNVVLVKNR